MAKLKDGFYKLTASSIGSNLHVLLAGGGAKPISDFALANGTNATGTWNIDISGNAKSSTLSKYLLTGAGTECDANTLAFSDHLLRWYSSIPSTSSNLPTVTGWLNGLLALPLHSNGVTAQLYFSATKALFYRSMASDNWNQIAYTTSDITGNANTASKLQNKVKIWGLDFDGSSDVSGGLSGVTSINSDGSIVLIGGATNNYSGARLHTKGFIESTDGYKINSLDVLRRKTDELAVGQETTVYASLPTSVYGTIVKLKYGTDKITGFTLNSSGNVGIGTASPSSKLHLYSAENTTLRIQSDGSGGDQGAICMKKASGNGLVFAVENRDFIWQTGADSLTGSGIERMRLTSNGNLSIGGTLLVIGTGTFNSQIISNVADGTAPLTVISTTKVANLNADLLDGYHVTHFMSYIKGSGYVQANLLNSELWNVAGGNGYIEYYDNGTWFNSRWGKVLAHYGFEGDLRGNASSATKLQTARTIWGQSFDGTGNVSGNLEMGISKVYWNDDASNYFITVNGAGKMYHTSYYGIFFRTGGSDRLAIDSTGNVGIGTTSPSYKLHVNGQVYSTGYVRSGSSDSYVLLGGGGHKALSDFAMASAYVKKAGDTMTGRLTMTGEGIIVTTATTSNYRAGVEFYKGTAADTTYSYDAQIGWHNTGGDGTGSICILPYATSTQPWGGTVGLFITKTDLKYNGASVWHSRNDGSGSGLDADLLDGYHASAFQLAGNYLINHGMSNSRPNGTTFTLPGGSNGVSMRSKATSGNDIGIFLLTDDNAFICNSSDNNYLFATFDTDKTADFSTASNAAFAVLSDHAGVSIKGLVTMDGYFNIKSHYFFVRDNANADWVVTDKSWQHEYAVIHSGNIGSQSVNYANSAGSVAWGNITGKPSSFAPASHSHSNYAVLGTYNNLTHAGNEFTFASAAFSGEMWINYRTASGSANGNITKYYFGNGKAGYLAYISSGYFSGTAAAANSVAWANVTGKPTIPSVGNGTIIINQGGSEKGRFTVNQSGTTTIELTDNNTTYSFAPKGSATQGIYLAGTNTFAAMTYSLKATVNSGTSGKLAYYSGANAISAYTSTRGDYYKPIYLSGGVPIECYARSIGSVTWGTNCSGYIQVKLFGPIVILQGYFTKINVNQTSSTNYVFKLPTGTPSPATTVGITLSLDDGYENDRNTIIMISGQYGYCNTGYNSFNPNGWTYYFSACYMA